MRVKYLALVLLTGFASVEAAAQSAPARKDIPSIARAANGAIVTIIMANNDKPIARGTGFLVRAGWHDCDKLPRHREGQRCLW